MHRDEVDARLAGGVGAGRGERLSRLDREIRRCQAEALGRVRERAPVVPDIHVFRRRGALRPSPEEAEKLEWRDCDSDSGFTALLRIGA